MTFIALTDAEVDAKSPIDDALMGKIQENFNDLDSRVVTAGNSPFVFELNGPLSVIRNYRRSLAYGLINKEFTPTICRMLLKKSGTSGNLTIDIRKHTRPNTPITGISHQYTGGSTGVAQQGSALATQSISRATTAINTQSITQPKTVLNVQSIVQVQGTNLWRYNLDVAPDSDWAVGDSFTAASCTAGGNNGTFTIAELNQDGYPSVVVTNASGVAQTGAAGTCALLLFSYNYTNPVGTQFVAGEFALFSSHTAGANDGTYALFKVNQGGNNVWIKHASGVTQGGAAGTLNAHRWVYNFTGAASVTDYIENEYAKMASHTTGSNNGNFRIVGVNVGGNNIIVYNEAGATQAGILGSVNTNRWKYNMPSDPSSDVAAADTIYASGHTNALNDGSFTVKEVTSSAIIVYNEAGVAQGGTAGTVSSTKKLIKFASDMSASYTTDSYIEMLGTVSGYYAIGRTKAPFKVIQVNRGGGANYNVVIDAAVVPAAPSQASPAGHVILEMKSIFSVVPSIAAAVLSLIPQYNLSTVSTDLLTGVVSATEPLMLYITEMHAGTPEDLTVVIS